MRKPSKGSLNDIFRVAVGEKILITLSKCVGNSLF